MRWTQVVDALKAQFVRQLDLDHPTRYYAMAQSLLLLGVFFASLILYGVWRLSHKSVPKGFVQVPGPKGAPVIGNTLQLSKYPQQDFRRWATEFGEIYQIQLGFTRWYMLNTPEAVKDIMDKQSVHTSSRTPMPVLSDSLSGGKRFLLMPYGTEWRKLRSIVHQLLTPKVSDTFRPSQEFESKQLLHDILTDNADGMEFYKHIRRYTLSVIMTSTYGRRVPVFVRLKDVFQQAARLISRRTVKTPKKCMG